MKLVLLVLFFLFIRASVDCQTLHSVVNCNSLDQFRTITGKASFYSTNLHGTQTSTGEKFDNNKMTGASNNFKLNTWVLVTNISNGKNVVVKINDRMHPKMSRKGRIVDVSRAAAKKLGFIQKGITKVKVTQIDAPDY